MMLIMKMIMIIMKMMTMKIAECVYCDYNEDADKRALFYASRIYDDDDDKADVIMMIIL